jgi:protein-tyrosine phosphatase
MQEFLIGSVTIVIAYLMRTCGIGFVQAYDLVRSRRPQAGPNLGFVLQLKKFERKLKGEREEDANDT